MSVVFEVYNNLRKDTEGNLVYESTYLVDGVASRVAPLGETVITKSVEELEAIYTANYRFSLAEQIEKAVQGYLDMVAKEHRYDGIISARSYAGFPNKYQAEALSLAEWASSCWEAVEDIEQEVTDGTRQTLEVIDVLKALPVFGGTYE